MKTANFSNPDFSFENANSLQVDSSISFGENVEVITGFTKDSILVLKANGRAGSYKALDFELWIQEGLVKIAA